MRSYNTSLYPFESRWIEIDGNQLHYIDQGQGDVILFSHPPVASSFMYRDFIRILSKKYRCIAIDYPGFGLSEKSVNYRLGIESQGDILEKFIAKLSLKNIYGLGHDTGGPSLFGVAIRKPDLFKGLILTDTIIFPTSEYPRINRMLGIVGSKWFTWFNAQTNLLINATYRFGIRTRKLSKEERNEYRSMFDDHARRKQVTAMLVNLRDSSIYMEQIKEGFERILNEKPTLLIYGEQDPVYKLGIADRTHELLQNAELHLINKEGHFPHEGQPKKMSNIIHHWIERVGND